MGYKDLLNDYSNNVEGSKFFSTRILALNSLINSFKEHEITLNKEIFKEIISVVNINKKEALTPWIIKYVEEYLSQPYQVVVKMKKEEKQIDIVNIDQLKPDDFASAADTPDDIEFLNQFGIKNPERPWEK